MPTMKDIEQAIALKLKVNNLTEDIGNIRKWLNDFVKDDCEISVRVDMHNITTCKRNEGKIAAVNEELYAFAGIPAILRGIMPAKAIYGITDGQIERAAQKEDCRELIVSQFSNLGAVRILNFLLNEKLKQRTAVMAELEAFLNQKNIFSHEAIDPNPVREHVASTSDGGTQ